jgi:hypothetical protein
MKDFLICCLTLFLNSLHLQAREYGKVAVKLPRKEYGALTHERQK